MPDFFIYIFLFEKLGACKTIFLISNLDLETRY